MGDIYPIYLLIIIIALVYAKSDKIIKDILILAVVFIFIRFFEFFSPLPRDYNDIIVLWLYRVYGIVFSVYFIIYIYNSWRKKKDTKEKEKIL